MTHSLHTLAANWLEMSQPYRPSAFWFWNADMNHARMDEVVAEMAASGVREFLIHPVHGMTIPYLSDEFFERYRHALTLAKKHGMKVWVYDEFGWPSGVAGGFLLREHPEYNGWFLKFDKDEHGAVTAVPSHPDVQLDNTLGAPWTQNEIGYLDTLSVDAVNCFIQMNHQRIYEECGALFHEVVRGFFTDEPTTMVINEKRLEGCWNTIGLPWTPELPARFIQMHGYDIQPHYTELADPVPCKYRQDYWAVVKQMHVEAYHAQMSDWCHAHGVGYTGHIGENAFLMQVKFSGSAYQCLSLMDEPGIDYLGMMPEPEHVFMEEVLVPSIARHSGHDRVYCEAFGISRYDLRLSDMLQRAQMFGIHGINDIALMGFHQGLTGVRKRTYWPPLFQSCPWWKFYPQFRDAFARSVALPSLGKHQARYAVLYPQYQLEQINPFQNGFGLPGEPVMALTEDICRAIYEAGETFEFVFPEMVDQAESCEGRIKFPFAEYDAIIAPSDFNYFEATDAVLEGLEKQNAQILRQTAAQIIQKIASEKPCWSDRLTLQTDAPAGSIRVIRYEFGDGEMFALRNTTSEAVSMNISSNQQMARWEPLSGSVYAAEGVEEFCMAPQGCLYLSLTSSAVPSSAQPVSGQQQPLEVMWGVTPETANTATLAGMEFHSADGWIAATSMDPFIPELPRNCTGIPAALRGETHFEMRAQFECESLPAQLGMLFETEYLRSLTVNGHRVDLSQAQEAIVWDKLGCVDILGLVKVGTNQVTAQLEYPQFETSVHNDAFFEADVMPSCDVCLMGDFRLVDGVITAESFTPQPLPISLMQQGWEQYMGVMSLNGRFSLSEQQASQIVGFDVELLKHDCLELLVDGQSLGKRVTPPYRFDVDGLAAGYHTLTLRVSSTSGNLLFLPADWGVAGVCIVTA